MTRTIRALHAPIRDDIGDLVTRRPLPGTTEADVDPFLFLNHHGPQTYAPNNNGLPFGPHPHRGFETVTFIVEGELAHHDSTGHASIIGPSGVQWMTAGSGIVHAEVSPRGFKEQGGPMEILQLWVNLPSRLKFTPPGYQGLQRDQIPSIQLDGAELNLIAGNYNGQHGPVNSITGHFLSTASLKAGARVTLPAPRDRSVFFYVVRGALKIAGADIPQWRLVEFNADGDDIALEAASDALILFGHGDPIREPVFAHGPFVMNTRDEIVQAIQDYQAGKFGAEPVV
jgi:quercetin 2,3-dioxygenase